MKKVFLFGVFVPLSLLASYVFLYCNVKKIKSLKDCIDSIDSIVKEDIKAQCTVK